ncbi:MAG: glutamate--tRNA ligase [Alphaproteobacteria bacterium]
MTDKQVVTRFAPSPTGYLHIGGARTALYNFLYAKAKGGKFLLRIEDTDRKRHTPKAVDAILDGMSWMGLKHDGEVVSQFARKDRHAEVAKKLVENGMAYYCYTTPEELKEMREKAEAEGGYGGYDGRWRDRDPSEAPEGVDPVIRLKTPKDGKITIKDEVQGEVTIEAGQLDDMILLRADGTPTYMLAVVVDDHDMGVTHVIRGDDHLTNAFRQKCIYEGMGWEVPTFAHIPLIHGPDGAKLSKRHGALGVEAYRDEMGYLPEAMRNYLLRLGWGHKDEEIISDARAIELFDLSGVGKSPSRMDYKKLENLNGHYMREADNARLAELARDGLAKELERDVTDAEMKLLTEAMDGLKQRAKSVHEIGPAAAFYFREVPLPMNAKAQKALNAEAKEVLPQLADIVRNADSFTAEALEASFRTFGEEKELKLGKIMMPLRSALTGSNVSPSLFEVMVQLGKDETIKRIDSAVQQCDAEPANPTPA